MPLFNRTRFCGRPVCVASTKKDKWNILWVKRMMDDDYLDVVPNQKVNHFPATYSDVHGVWVWSTIKYCKWGSCTAGMITSVSLGNSILLHVNFSMLTRRDTLVLSSDLMHSTQNHTPEHHPCQRYGTWPPSHVWGVLGLC